MFEEHPMLKEAFGNIQKEFQRTILDCPPRGTVHCDLEPNTTVTSTITANELHSLLQRPDLNFYGTMPDGEWIAFVTRDGSHCYSTIPISADEFAQKYGDSNQRCYYTIRLERTYDNGPSLSPSHNVMPK